MEDFTGIVAILSVFIGAPSAIFLFVYNLKKRKYEVEGLQVQQRILELEVEKERLHLAALQEENRKLDRLIDGSDR